MIVIFITGLMAHLVVYLIILKKVLNFYTYSQVSTYLFTKVLHQSTTATIVWFANGRINY